MKADRYSRAIAFLKVVLPLLALALLSTLFLISRAVTPTAEIPFADSEVQERLTNQQITGPYFSGTSANGDQIAFIAERLNSPDGTVGSNRAEEVIVQVDLAGGNQVMMEADVAEIDIAADRSDLTGDVEVVTSNGYHIRTEQLKLKLSGLDVEAPSTIRAETPVGNLEAGTMRLFVPEDQSGAQLLFTGGVKLLYQPGDMKE